MGLVYILVRTFPFWAIPLGFGLIGGWWNAKKHSGTGKMHWLYLMFGILLIGTSAFFLANQGHMKAVPLAREIIEGFKD